MARLPVDKAVAAGIRGCCTNRPHYCNKPHNNKLWDPENCMGLLTGIVAEDEAVEKVA